MSNFQFLPKLSNLLKCRHASCTKSFTNLHKGVQERKITTGLPIASTAKKQSVPNNLHLCRGFPLKNCYLLSSPTSSVFSIRRKHSSVDKFILIKNGLKENNVVLFEIWWCWLKLLFVGTFVDRTLTYEGFKDLARQVMFLVSSHLAHGRFEELAGLVEEKHLREVEENYDRLEPACREYLEIKPDTEVFFAFKDVKVKVQNKKTMVEILMMMGSFPGGREAFRENVFSFMKSGELGDLPLMIFSNYRFVRFYEDDGGDSEWTINALNCFTRSITGKIF